MAEPQQPVLADYIADDVREQADVLVEDWLRWIVEEVSLRPARMLPREAILDHIPDVVRGVSEALRGPAEAASVAFPAVKTHGRMRHDQGFDIEELLKEYHGLGRFIREGVSQALQRYPGDADPVEVGRLVFRLSEALASVTDLTVAVYRATEVQQKRELHQQLEDYVQTISHELKQPLNAITAGTGMLEHKGDDISKQSRERYIRIIRNGIERSIGLIDDIRTLVLIEGAQQHEEWQPIENAIALVFREMSEQARRLDVQLRAPHPIPRVNVDPTRVEIALVNLISNAIKYSDPDKPERWAEVTVSRTEPEAGNRWKVRVADNGLGIPEAVHPQVFERHFRAHPGVAQGTGLGLAITRQLIEQAGGSIRFESTEGGGSTFQFIVPGFLDGTFTEGVPPGA